MTSFGYDWLRLTFSKTKIITNREDEKTVKLLIVK